MYSVEFFETERDADAAARKALSEDASLSLDDVIIVWWRMEKS